MFMLLAKQQGRHWVTESEMQIANFSVFKCAKTYLYAAEPDRKSALDIFLILTVTLPLTNPVWLPFHWN